MSNPEKLRGGSESELTKFKKLWRDSLSESAREYWRQLFISDSTQAQIRKEIFAKVRINLTYDGQLNAFRDWEMEQRKRDLEAERMIEDERRVREEHGEKWTLDQIRTEVLKRSYARTLATGDFKLGLQTVKQDVNAQNSALDRDRFARESCELFLKWFKDQAARDIAESSVSNDEKISKLRELYFADVDELQKSGAVKLPE